MKLFLLALAALMAVAVVACGGGPTAFDKGKLISGTITGSDADVEGWKSQPYEVDVLADVEYLIRLTSTEGNTMGIWGDDADGYIVEVDSEESARTVTLTFSESGFQKLFLRSPDSDVPSPFTFMLWLPNRS